jgi:hypothetical protein
MLYQAPSTAIAWSVYEFFKYYLNMRSRDGSGDDYETLAETHPAVDQVCLFLLLLWTAASLHCRRSCGVARPLRWAHDRQSEAETFCLPQFTSPFLHIHSLFLSLYLTVSIFPLSLSLSLFFFPCVILFL